MQIDLTQLTPSGSLVGDEPEDTELLKQMLREAEDFIFAFSWCDRIKQSFFGCGIGGICAIFLFEIVPSRKGVDSWLWVIVGDLPPAYLVIDESPTPSAALKTYMVEMRRWIAAAQRHESVADLIPVNVPPTAENGAALEGRLSMLEKLGICL
jgi:hypothetical protein